MFFVNLGDQTGLIIPIGLRKAHLRKRLMFCLCFLFIFFVLDAGRPIN